MKTIRRLGAATLILTLAAAPANAVSHPAVEAEHGMVVSSQHLATDVGARILQQGGNAVDAAVAVGYAEAVTNECCGNIGGGGFMLIRLASGKNTFINFRETAPAAATASMYLDQDGNPRPGASLQGYLAAGVPGTVLGMDTALRQYGTMTREQVMAPAIKLAREGFVLTLADTDIIDAGAKHLRADPEAAHVFFHADGTPLQPGDLMVQTDLGNTLAAIAKDGPDAFYKGARAQAVEDAAKAHGGILSAVDFAAYTVTETPPVQCTYRGYTVLSAPPPSSGGVTMCEILNILEGYDMTSLGFHSAATIHLMTEAMRHAYVDRNTFLGDPAFVPNPLGRLLSKDYAAQIRLRIDPDHATPSKDVQPGSAPHERTETTHYSVVDSSGNAVAVTYTVNGLFGANVIAPGTGYLLNDEMDDFTTKIGTPNMFGLVQGARNAIAPGKRPLSSMAPTIVTKDGKLAMVVGSPGGSRIITITLQVLLNLIDYGMQPQEAVDAPRIHSQWLPDLLYSEPFAVPPDARNILAAMGHKIVDQAPWGAAEIIVLPAAKTVDGPASSGGDSRFGGVMRPGHVYGANDNRRPSGSAVGE